MQSDLAKGRGLRVDWPMICTDFEKGAGLKFAAKVDGAYFRLESIGLWLKGLGFRF